jgi:hypothetical protein
LGSYFLGGGGFGTGRTGAYSSSSGRGGSSLASSSWPTGLIGNDADRTELPPRSMTASVARKSPTSLPFTLKFTRSALTCPALSK